jgi:hypothetical protein
MRKIGSMIAVVGVVLGFTLVGRADEEEEGLKIVEAAIKATGGAAKVDQLKAVTLKGKGTASEGGGATFAFDLLVQGQDRFRLQLDVNENGNAMNILVIADGDKGWIKGRENVREFPAQILSLLLGELHALRSAQMLTTLKDKAVKLSPLGKVKVDDRPAIGLKIVQKDRPEVDLFFDKDTHLPVKCQLRVKEPDKEQEVTHSWFFSGHKEIDGVKHPMKVTLNRDDTKLLEIELSEVKVEDKVDENSFAMP